MINYIFRLVFLTILLYSNTKIIEENQTDEKLINSFLTNTNLYNISCIAKEIEACLSNITCDSIKNNYYKLNKGNYICNNGKYCKEYKNKTLSNYHYIPVCDTNGINCEYKYVNILKTKQICNDLIKNQHCVINIYYSYNVQYTKGYYVKNIPYITKSGIIECGLNSTNCYDKNKYIFETSKIYYDSMNNKIYSYNNTENYKIDINEYNNNLLKIYILSVIFVSLFEYYNNIIVIFYYIIIKLGINKNYI